MSRNSSLSRRLRPAVALTVSFMFVMAFSSLVSASTLAGVKITKVSTDPYTNQSSQHKSEVEPDNYSYGSTIVSVFQTGRFSDGGSSNTGWATSTDSGKTWSHGFMPGTTVYATPKGKFARISDPSVAYDAKHQTWLVSGLAINSQVDGQAVVVNSSSDGVKWNNPVSVADNGGSQFFDKDWIACDNTASSPYYGHCYVEYDIATGGDLVQMSASTDGGKTWGASKATQDNASGLGGQPVTQPNGTVVVPFDGNSIQAFISTNGGQSWGHTVTIGSGNAFSDPGIRSPNLVTAEVDGAGTVYAAWASCQFEKNCSSNDIVYSTSTDGQKWSKTQRVPIDPANSNNDHFIPGIGVDKSTSGSAAKIGLTFYYYPKANCAPSTCQLFVGFISSTNGGSTWSTKQQLAGPMKLAWLAQAGGAMVGDYVSTEVDNGIAWPIFANASAPAHGKLHENMYTVTSGLPVTGGSVSSAGDRSYPASQRPTHFGTQTAF